MDFNIIKQAVAAQFKSMSGGKLYRTGATKDGMWDTYLGSFPAGTNPIYREQEEHNCNCCKQFIRAIGNVVAIRGDQLVSIWDVSVSEPAYQAVANAMSAYVKSQPVAEPFLHYEPKAGTDKNFEQLVGGGVQTWQHFFANIPAAFVLPKANIPTRIGDVRSTFDVMHRGLTTISDEAISTVKELISQNSLYRGEEHRHVVTEFAKLKAQFDRASNKELFVWERVDTAGAVARIRNSAIGTLLVDLSEGMELEDAVKSFESKVAPTNYRRPKPLVTQAMIDNARKTVEELGLVSALDRRFARLSDVSVNNVLFADREAKSAMRDGVFDSLSATTVTDKKKFDKVEDVPIDKFISEILPQAKSIEVMVEGRHTPNFVSLIAPVDPTANPLFKWGNPFSWSYNGEVADSIKERVKQAGGKVEGFLCCRLAWYSFDDLDLHMVEPHGKRIYFGDKRSATGGQLDVDMNAGMGHTETPVENIFYPHNHHMIPGEYQLVVNQFSKRNSDPDKRGFDIEIDANGTVYRLAYPDFVASKANVPVATITYGRDKSLTVNPLLTGSTLSKEVWGVKTEQFHKAAVVMASPNHWDGQGVGNRHWFFMLDGARNDGGARGFYNEFLKSDLDKHRKVLELVGSKTKVKDDPNQLSGLGFSTTQRNNILCRVSGSFTRIINIVI